MIRETQNTTTEKLDPHFSVRVEHDSLGTVAVPAEAQWGAQTQRSLENFPIGEEKMPREIIQALAQIKKAAAAANVELGVIDPKKARSIKKGCDAILRGELDDQFPLVVWQTGSGTQTNMNVNEVVAHAAANADDQTMLHPNDDVNRSQSSNDTFPSAIHIAALQALHERLYPVLEHFIEVCHIHEERYKDLIICGRTHLQDAVPLSFSQEIAGWRGLVEQSLSSLQKCEEALYELPLGGTAVGTGLNTPPFFGKLVVKKLSEQLKGFTFKEAQNRFASMSAKEALLTSHGALKALAANLMKIANDVRWLASGPRSGLGELQLPANEPGSSIMPGKVNPTQCEALTMVCAQVMGNDVSLGIAGSQGNFQLNVYMPLIAYNYLQSVRLLSDALESFVERCFAGMKAQEDRMNEQLKRSLMLVTRLAPELGYERAAAVAHLAHEENLTLKEAALQLSDLDEKRYEELINPWSMAYPHVLVTEEQKQASQN